MIGVNQNARPSHVNQPTHIVIHASAGGKQEAGKGLGSYFSEWKWAVDKHGENYKKGVARVSYHYAIDNHGTVWQYVEDNRRAWHAGKSAWQPDGLTDLNHVSLGLAFIATEKEPYTASQVVAMTLLIQKLMHRYEIPIQRVLGHKEVSPKRKTDPKYLLMDEFRGIIRGSIPEQSQRVKNLVQQLNKELGL